jgi:hypothetical protein
MSARSTLVVREVAFLQFESFVFLFVLKKDHLLDDRVRE